jgi:hypothetical protein
MAQKGAFQRELSKGRPDKELDYMTVRLAPD